MNCPPKLTEKAGFFVQSYFGSQLADRGERAVVNLHAIGECVEFILQLRFWQQLSQLTQLGFELTVGVAEVLKIACVVSC